MPIEPEAFYAELGRRISRFRKEKRFAQGRLAELVRLSRTSITNIERGRQHVAVHLLVNLAEQLDVSLEELVPYSRTAGGHPPSNLPIPGSLDASQREWVARVISGTKRDQGGD